MTASVFMPGRVVLDCGQKCQRFVHFRDDPGKHRDLPAFAIVRQEPAQDRPPQNYAPSRVTATAFDGGTWIGGCLNLERCTKLRVLPQGIKRPFP
jgi:hypothetical protein